MTLRLTVEEARSRGFLKGEDEAKQNKYNVSAKVKRTVDGILFASKKEAQFYALYNSLWKAGEILFFLRQVPFRLPGKVKYLLDFMVFNKDGTIEFIDVKGCKTDVYIIKKKQVEDIYKITIREV